MLGQLGLMYGDVGFSSWKKTGRLKGSVHNAIVMSGLTKTDMSKGLTMMKEGWGEVGEGGTVNDVG